MFSITQWIISLVSSLGYLGVILAMTIESASIPLPSEVIMGIGGYLVYKGELNLFLVAFAGAIGNIIGSTIMYTIGAKGGRPVLQKHGHRVHFDEEKFKRVDKWFIKYGDKIVFFSQLLPVVRTFVSLPAGILKINYSKFAFYTFTGAFLWCFLLAFVSSLLGEAWDKLLTLMRQFEIGIGVLVVMAIVLYLFYRLYLSRKKKL
ncbi:MAG: DedA family protein [Candidatus Dojkabacteria bacterium]